MDVEFFKIDDQLELKNLGERIYEQVVEGFQTCSEKILQHLAGQMCLYCDPFFIENFEYNKHGYIEIEFDYNVCYEFQRYCYKYIEGRNMMGGMKNIIIMIDRLYDE